MGTQYGVKNLVDSLTAGSSHANGVWLAFGFLMALIAADNLLWRVAITAQQFCSIETALNLFVSDGISKTAVWRKQDVLIKGTSQMRERSRY